MNPRIILKSQESSRNVLYHKGVLNDLVNDDKHLLPIRHQYIANEFEVILFMIQIKMAKI